MQKSRRHSHNKQRGPWIPPAFVQEYKEAFHKHYPQYAVDVRPKRMSDGSIGFSVAINGAVDNSRPLSQYDLMEAIVAFNK